MKLTCKQKELTRALSLVGRAVNPNNTLPVLNNILLRAEKSGDISLSATNLEIAIHAHFKAEVKEAGALTVPAKVFESYVSLLSSEEVQLEVLENLTLLVKSKNSETKIKGIVSDEFPLLPKVNPEHQISLPVEAIKESLEQVAFSASVNISRPILMGVYWKFEKDGLRLVATDSYRLAEQKIPLEGNAIDLNFVTPSRTAQELSRILSATEEKEFQIEMSKNQVLFKVEGMELISRLIEGHFPPYEQILPKTSKTMMVLNTSEFILGLKKVAIIAKETTNNLRIKVDPSGMKISTEETQIGSGTTNISGKVEGESVEVALNAQYLLDVLAHLKGENVHFGLNDPLSPVMVKPEKESGYLYIIMPLKV